jgi:serine/threonine-protein kinase
VNTSSDPSTPSALVRRPSPTDSAPSDGSLPSDIVDQAARRLRALALVFAFVFFMATFFSAFFDPSVSEFDDLHDWGIDALSIALALVVAWMTTRPRIGRRTIINVGLAFQVVGSYGIAMAQYWGIYEGLEHQKAHLEVFGLSWVAVWMMLFAIVVPAHPRKALLASVGSASAVPVVLALTMRYGGTTIRTTPAEFVLGAVMPYLLVILMTHVGARAIYTLGREVAKARELGSYRLTERLGQGGMGEVWRAEHRMLARPAAIKLVRAEVLGQEPDAVSRTLRRFEREAQATALLRSPNTIELYDFGIADDGAFYYVMELLDGYDLDTLVQEFGPLPAGRVIALLRQACDSLGEAHDAGLVHRDVKPANIFLCRYGRNVDFVKLLDFGLVKQRKQEDLDVRMTAENLVGGTPSFMSPEQVTGERALDGRSDLYALGCVAYWLAAGQLVFSGTAVATMMAHLRDDPVPPSQRTELGVPDDLEQVILRCLDKNPDARPQTADELAALLAACDSGGWTDADARRWWESARPAP